MIFYITKYGGKLFKRNPLVGSPKATTKYHVFTIFFTHYKEVFLFLSQSNQNGLENYMLFMIVFLQTIKY